MPPHRPTADTAHTDVTPELEYQVHVRPGARAQYLAQRHYWACASSQHLRPSVALDTPELWLHMIV